MKNRRNRGFTLIEAVLIIVVISLIGLAGWYAYHQHSKRAGTSDISVNGTGQPQIPTSGAYLGAWINPVNPPKTGKLLPGEQEIQQVATFNALIGKQVAVLHVYTPFKTPLPVTALTAIDKNGSIPLIDWTCGDLSQINSGADDMLITNYAQSIKQYAKPVFLRCYWEMNIATTFNSLCGG